MTSVSIFLGSLPCKYNNIYREPAYVTTITFQYSTNECLKKGVSCYNFSEVRTWIITHWGQVTYICITRLTIIGSDKNDLLPERRQAIIWTNTEILLIGPMGTNFSEFLIKIYTFSFRKMHFQMSSGQWRPFCLGLNVLNYIPRFCPNLITHPCHNPDAGWVKEGL